MKIHWSRPRRTHERRRDEDHPRASRLGPAPDGPRLRDEGRSRDGAGRLARARREDLLVLQPALPGALRRRSRALAEGRPLDRRDGRPGARARLRRRRAPGERVEYVCPMDPEVLETKPGPCRICGMALEPRTVTLAEEKNPELEDMTRRFRVSLALTVPLLLARHGRDAARAPRPPLRFARRAGVARAASRDAGRPLGRVALLRAHVDELPHRPTEHVHAHRHRHRRSRGSTAWSPSSCPASSRSPSAATTGRWGATSSRRR